MISPAVLLTFCALALAESPATISTKPNLRDPEGFGVGVVLGLPMGVTFAYKPQLLGFFGQATVGWEFTTGTLAVQADAAYTFVTLHSKEIEAFSFPFYVGVGPRLRLLTATSAYAPPVFGVRVPIGLGFYHDGVPIEGFLELTPVVGLAPRPRAAFDVVLGGRWYVGG